MRSFYFRKMFYKIIIKRWYLGKWYCICVIFFLIWKWANSFQLLWSRNALKLYSCKFDFKTMQIFCKAKLNLKAIPKIFKSKITQVNITIYLLLLNRFSRVRLCATPQTAAHEAPPSLGFSRQEHWSGLPFPSPMHESEKWKWSLSVVSDS